MNQLYNSQIFTENIPKEQLFSLLHIFSFETPILQIILLSYSNTIHNNKCFL